jgi:hypothetical protein
MHIEFGTALVLTTLVASLVLLFQKSGRVFPTLVVIAAGVQALMVFGIMSLTLAKLRIDMILPAILLVAGTVCWGRTATKGGITSATIVALSGAMQLFIALRVFT